MTKQIFIFCSLLSIGYSSFAKDSTLRGTLTWRQSHKGIIGVVVYVEGTSDSVKSDRNGLWKIIVKEKDAGKNLVFYSPSFGKLNQGKIREILKTTNSFSTEIDEKAPVKTKAAKSQVKKKK